MIVKSKAIALHSTRFGEKSLVAYLYTQEFGRVTLMVNAAFGRGKESKKAIFFHPLNLIDTVFYKANSETGMGRLREVSSAYDISSIRFQNVKRAIAVFLGEVIYRTVREEERNHSLFAFLENSILALEATDEGVQNFHILFLAQLSKYLGFFPGGTYSADTPYFDLKGGVFISHAPNHPVFLGQEQSSLLYKALHTNYMNASDLQLNGKQRNLFLGNMLNYYSFHIGSFSEILSLPVLKQVFED